MTEATYDSAVAIVGMSGRFPGAADTDELWRNLAAGLPGLRTISSDELRAAGLDPEAAAADPTYVAVGGPLRDIEEFDAGVFGFNPQEAATMEPQHRLFLECAWEALERAGYCPTETPGQVGVFAGCGFPDYLTRNLDGLDDEPGGHLLLAAGSERDSLTSLVAYKLGLRGPSITVQTFCSTSLVAVHQACQSILTYECDMALAGGAAIGLPQPAGYRYEQGGILSPDGVVRSFDAAATGSVMGNGVGVVALKRMTDAVADGAPILAVILGSAVNNDGSARAGYPAPGVDGQAEVIESAMTVAGVKPETVGYVECHATGTVLGDAVELAAMTRAFPAGRAEPCVLGTLKPSIGHLDRASGVTGLIRATQALRHGTLPATPNFGTPNSALAAAGDRFAVLDRQRPWPAGPHPRRAGVSSFGLGGTNAHVVLQEAPPVPARTPRPGPHLLTFSAADPAALNALTERLHGHLRTADEAELADVAYTLQVSRGQFALRRAVVCRDLADAVSALDEPERWLDGEPSRRDPTVRLVNATGQVTAWFERLSVRLGDGPVEVVVPAEPSEEWLLGTLARLWLDGCAVDWPALHEGRGRRVPLPTYPFQRRRHWVEPKQRAEPPGYTGWTYLPSWRQRPLPELDLDARLRAAGPWLVLSADPRGEALVDRLTRAGAEVSTARPGDAFGLTDDGDFVVGDDLAELFDSLLVAPRTIVHGWSLGSPDGPGSSGGPASLGGPGGHARDRRGYGAALQIAGALAGDGYAGPTELVLLTSGAVGVTGGDLRDPGQAAVGALAPTLMSENDALRCRHVDVDDRTDAEVLLGVLAQPHEGPVAIRCGEPWLRHFEPLPLEERRPPLGSTSTVLITGGLGDVGMALARHLADRYGCRLVLTGRTELPPRETWQAYLDGGADGRAARHVRNVLDLEARGARVLACSADVADVRQMRAVVDTAVERFGGIDVVVHGAGAQDPRYFTMAHQADEATSEAHFRTKVTGFLALQEALAGRCDGPRLTLSSIAAVLGGPALGPYAAANAVLDAAARAARRDGHGRWTTVDWDTWAVDPRRAGGVFQMTVEEGAGVFERVLAAAGRLGHVVVSTGPLAERVRRWVVGDEGPDRADAVRPSHPRPNLDTAYVEPAGELEAAIAGVWAEVLGLAEVGAVDNFFELGGHSLVAIQVAARIRDTVRAAVPVTAIVENPTVRQLAATIRSES
ncbi:SDR family NAD(P)-dependent oxidoreductase [Micromonospora sp. WMMD1102]|uniref:SDR family NAD(P)-dependent oxidoreductase n=1 Tax=Micromonospora sp. WMMD1102 TaxID=3016105 RepID=UPI0024150F93|nr:SDR family NAD(P)-dependent oxidoreductase [Micromonospora sp. WMMD1102]MDG4785096.1 SDR family NAD(P)-dependent oxidoreductase [Micromonospora sp. WMMD1102]